MKKLALFTLFAFLALFSYSCPTKSGSVNTMASESNQALIVINIEFLCQHWVHSREEEQQTDKAEIYRLKDFKKFPPSRFRMQYIFYKSGDCEWYYLAPNDTHHFKRGKWRVDPKDKSILQIIKADITESYRVTEIRKDMLRIALMKPNS